MVLWLLGDGVMVKRHLWKMNVKRSDVPTACIMCVGVNKPVASHVRRRECCSTPAFVIPIITEFTSSVASNCPFPLSRFVSGRFMKGCYVRNMWQTYLFQAPVPNVVDNNYRASKNVSRVLSTCHSVLPHRSVLRSSVS